MSKISKVIARQVFDSRGNPTIETEVFVKDISASAICPSGASTGEFEALELRDGDKARYHGKGVLNAVNNVIKEFGPSLIGNDASNQSSIDELLIKIDGSSNKSTFGANASLGISMACAVVSASFYKKQLYDYLNPSSSIMPVPMINVLNGGMHADQGSDLQEIMLFPHGAKSFNESIHINKNRNCIIRGANKFLNKTYLPKEYINQEWRIKYIDSRGGLVISRNENQKIINI